MTYRPLLVGLAALGGLACSSSTEPVDLLPERQPPAGVIFGVQPTDPGVAGATDPPTIEVQTGRIVVRGILPAPSLCFREFSRVDVSSDSVTISIAGDDTGVFGCPAWGGPRYYRAIVDLSAGPHRLRVRHWVVDRSDSWVTDTAIVVP